MNNVKIDEVTVTKKAKVKGSNRIAYDVDLNGVPFGQIWTFKAAGEVHPFHVKTLAGAYGTFKTYAEAEAGIRNEM